MLGIKSVLQFIHNTMAGIEEKKLAGRKRLVVLSHFQ
jgi:hypothetical protein